MNIPPRTASAAPTNRSGLPKPIPIPVPPKSAELIPDSQRTSPRPASVPEHLQFPRGKQNPDERPTLQSDVPMRESTYPLPGQPQPPADPDGTGAALRRLYDNHVNPPPPAPETPQPPSTRTHARGPALSRENSVPAHAATREGLQAHERRYNNQTFVQGERTPPLSPTYSDEVKEDR